MIFTNQCSCTVFSEITSVRTKGRQKGNMLLKNMLRFFLQAKPHTHSTTVSSYYKTSVISSPPGPQALLFELQESWETYRKGHVQKLQKQTNPKLLCSLQQSYPSLWEAVAQAGVGFVVLTTLRQYKHWQVKAYTPARGTAREKARPISIDNS